MWVLIFLLGAVLYYPAVFNFFTHDNFFHLKISQVSSMKDVWGFFNLTQAPEGWGYYRPLTTQVLYLIETRLFKLNPVALNLMAFLMFFIVIYLVYRLAWLLTKNRQVTLLTTFFYTVSATHFTHLYYVADQELGTAIFYFLTLVLNLKFLESGGRKFYLLSVLSFIGALMSRESAVMIPLALILVYGLKKINWKIIIKLILPFLGILTIYGYLHLAYYGLVQGDSYIWSFSLKTALNSWAWYGLWSLNLPQMLIDYIGPGLKVNPNLWLFYGQEMKIILGLFAGLVGWLLINLTLSLKKLNKKNIRELGFSLLWFLSLLLPVIFLPWHKFTIYLTMPLFGVVLGISRIVSTAKFKLIFGLIIFLLLSVNTLNLTRRTHWVTLGGAISKRVYIYFSQLAPQIQTRQKVYFYTQISDSDLPWDATGQLRVTLSGNNFFEVFFKDKFEWTDDEEKADIKLPSRQFLGY